MPSINVLKLIHATLNRMREKGELPEDDPSTAGLQSSVVLTMAELEVVKQQRDAVAELPGILEAPQPTRKDDGLPKSDLADVA
jgi:hypothetical protein